MRVRSPRITAAAVALCVLVAPLMLGAAAAPQLRPAGFCLPLIWCPDPEPSPDPSPETSTTASPSPSPASPSPTDMAEAPHDDDAADAPEPSPQPAPAEPDDQAPVFTSTPAQMAAGGLSFTGLKSIGLVTVPTVDGDSVRVLKISADSITISDFALTVRPPEEPGLVTDADTMTLRGNVTVYLGSITATTRGGSSLTLGLDTPPPLDAIEPGLVRVTMGLVGSIADSITYTNTDQQIVQ